LAAVWWVVGTVLNGVLSLIGIPLDVEKPAAPFRTDHGSVSEQVASYVILGSLLIGAYLVYGVITAMLLVTVSGVDFQTAQIFFGTLIAATGCGFVVGRLAIATRPTQVSRRDRSGGVVECA
jgi:hypothetical protein